MKIAILDDYHHRAQHFADWASADFAEFDFISEHIGDPRALVARLKPYDAIGVMRERTPLPREVIGQLPNLKLIVTTGRQNAAIDLQAATDSGVMVCTTTSPGHATAELAFLMIMSLFRQFVPLANDLKERSIWQAHMGQDLRGKTLGILGLGRLGSQVAALGQAIGMQVIAWSQNLTESRCAEKRVQYVERMALFKLADVVSIHLRLSERTRQLVGHSELELLGPTGYLVNTSRAEIVDEVALLRALNDGQIAGLATDVFSHEPVAASHPLVTHPRVLATPHVGYCTQETFAVFYAEMLDAFKAFHAGHPVNQLNHP